MPGAATAPTLETSQPKENIMSVRVAINGFGRTGRAAFRAAYEREADIEWVAINDLAEPAMLAQLLRHDTVYGPFAGIGRGRRRRARRRRAPDRDAVRDATRRSLPWAELGVDVVIESTGPLPRPRRRREAPRGRRAQGDRLGAGEGSRRHRRARRQLRRRSTTPRRTGSSRTRPARRTASRRWRRCCTRRSASGTG